jgi:group I intron endonuclease
MHQVYIVQCTKTWLAYVGQSTRFADRISGHKHRAKTGVKHPLYDAIREHGWENFTATVVQECETAEEADAAEAAWTKLFNTTDRACGYNIAMVRTPAEESRRKQSETMSAKPFRWNAGQFRPGKESVFKGRKHTEDTKRALRDAALCRPATFAGRRHTAESKRKMSETKRGKNYPNSGQFKKGQASPMRGRKAGPRSPESIAKQRETVARKRAEREAKEPK